MPILRDSFPFVQKSPRTLVRTPRAAPDEQPGASLTVCCSLKECYVHNLLRLTVYVPSIRRDVLELIVGQLLKLDVSAAAQPGC